MFYCAFTPLTKRTLPCQAGKKVHRFFSLISGRERIKVALLVEIDKWNELRNKGSKLYASNQRYFSENHSISSLRKQLKDAFPSVVQDFVDDPKYKDIPEAVNCFKDTLERNVTAMKDNLPISFLHCYKSMEDPRNLTPQNIKRANILASCLQMMLAWLVVVDDIIDGAEYRLGRKCWHKNEDVGSRAIIDGLLLDFYIYQLLKKHFSHLPMYVPTVRVFRESLMKAVVSFYLDCTSLDTNKGLITSHLTSKRFRFVTTYKNLPLAFELPYMLARCLSNKFQIEISPQTRDILIKLGEFAQIQNDFRDCYDDVYVSNKTANDIEEGKATWLITVAFEKANPEQRRSLEAHYGKKNVESVNIVKDLYKILEIPKAYAKCEKNNFDFFEKNIEEISKLTCLELMFKPLTKLYQQYI